MKRIKFGLLALAAVCGISAAATTANSTAKRVLPFKYYAQRTGTNTFVWVQAQPGAPLSCLPQTNVSCTITTTVAPATIANYNSTYLPGRQKSPASPTNFIYR